MAKIRIENWQWRVLSQQAACIVGDNSLLKPIPGSEAYNKQVDEARPRVAVPHIRLREFSDIDFLHFATMQEDEQERILRYLLRSGIVKDPEGLFCRLADWRKRSGFGYSHPTPPYKMSDDILDRETQYFDDTLHTLDEYEQYEEEFQNS